jgi:putative oxidoreductase
MLAAPPILRESPPMIENFATRALAPLLLRLALAVVFIYHGLPKVQVANGTTWMPPEAAMAPVMQALVAWGEFIGGVALMLGLFTRVAAAGIIVIMIGAIVTVHGSKGFGLAQGGYEYNFVLICVAAALVCIGAGVISLDNVIREKMKGPAKY